jgi:hypothetical protein
MNDKPSLLQDIAWLVLTGMLGWWLLVVLASA